MELFPLDDECLCVLPSSAEDGEVEEFELTDEPPLEALDVGPDVEFELAPFKLVVEPSPLDVDLVVDGMEEGGACEGREWGYPGIGWRSLFGDFEGVVPL